MVWVLGVIATLVVGVFLCDLLLSPDPPRRKPRPAIVRGTPPAVRRRPVTRAAAASPASSGDDAFTAGLGYGMYASHTSYDSPSHDACDTGADASLDVGDCGSDGGGGE
jgi:hypothetical protein